MNQSKPTVLVTIPTYRRTGYLRETINSVIRQTFPDWRCIVFDNDPGRTAEGVVEELADSRIDYRNNGQNLGPTGNWNRCREAAIESEMAYWALLEDDNLWDESFLETAVESLGAHPEAAIYHSSCRLFKDSPEKVVGVLGSLWQADRDRIAELSPDQTVPILCACGIMLSATLSRVDKIRTVEAFDTNHNQSADYMMFTRIALRFNIVTDPQPRIWYRIHDDSVSGMFKKRGGRQRQVAYAKQMLLRVAVQLGVVTPQTFLERTMAVETIDPEAVPKTILMWLRSDAPEDVRKFGRAVLTGAGKRRRTWERSTWEFKIARLAGDWVIPHLPVLRRWACLLLRKPDPEARGNWDL